MQTVAKPVTATAAVATLHQIRVWAGLALVMGIAILVRGAVLGYDLPYIYHPDEPGYVDIIQRIYHGDLNPHFFNYPTLFFYLNALVYLPVFGIAGLFGQAVEVLPVDTLVMGATLVRTPEAVLVSRGVSVLFGLGSLVLVFFIGRKLAHSPWPGLLAALLLALSPTAIKINRFITPDTFVVFFILAAIFFSLRLYRDGRQRDYLWAGICVGLAASSKYNAGLVVLAPVIAHFLRHGWDGLVRFSIYRTLLVSGLAFLLTSPFVLLDVTEFWEDFTYEAQHYSSIGHPGMEGDSFNWYMSYLWMVEGAGVVGGALFLVARLVGSLPWPVRRTQRAASAAFSADRAAVSERGKELVVVFVFPLLYFAFISGFMVRNDRTLLPVIPFLLLAAGLGLYAMFRRARSAGWAGRLWLAGGLIALALSLAFPLLTLVHFAKVIHQPAPMVQAVDWVEANLPPGTRIAMESYSPYLDPQRYQLTPIFRAIMKDFAWYRAQEIDYLILARSMYGRYYCEPQRYALEKGQYERLFRAFEPAAVFENPLPDGPIDPLIRGVGVRSLCPPRADLLDLHQVIILKVR